MSVLVDTQMIEEAERVLSGEEMYQLGLAASLAPTDHEHDLVDAHKWFNLAAMHGSQEARIYRAELAGEMTTEEIAEAQKRAREYLSSHTPRISTLNS